ncbi:MAG: serine hydrolase [Deltaproteobacteria bacterium]|nr:serine hydrolase [Deltaproteobacteria bacterium]
MRACLLAHLITFAVACSGSNPPVKSAAPTPTPVDPEPVAVEAARPAPAGEVVAEDTPRTTAGGNRFVVPAGWTIAARAPATIVTAPEGDVTIVFADVQAADADAAVEAAWSAYGPAKKRWALEIKQPVADRDGWSQIQTYAYQTSPDEKRQVWAQARFANGAWTVIISDAAIATANKRGGQLGTLLGQVLPKGFERESFAGKKANPLDAAHVAALAKFIEDAQQALDVPGVGLGLVQDGKVVFAGGFGVREKGKPAKIDGDTRFVFASNTKALTTLMLAKLVDEKKLAWDTPVTTLLPQFKLGDPDTTAKVQVRHLICACTGMPRHDLEMLFEPGRINTAERVLASLAMMQPTSKFGELFQYSNPMAAAAGFVGGHVAFPKLELGAAYDEAMRTRVFEPLGMTSATFDFKRALAGNVAAVHSEGFQDKTSVVPHKLNETILFPNRPAGGLWVSVRDMLRYVQMELAEGKLPNGKVYLPKETLLARRDKQVATGKDTHYGMGLSVSSRYGVTVVDHGGDIAGFHSNMIWLPEHGVGAVIVVNSDAGGAIRNGFRRKLLEVLFDGRPEADAALATSIRNHFEALALARKQIRVPAAPEHASKLAAKYANESLGDVVVTRAGAAVTFDFGEWKSEVATRTNPDGTISYVTITPPLAGFELSPGEAGGKRTLVVRDAQHEYVFTER